MVYYFCNIGLFYCHLFILNISLAHHKRKYWLLILSVALELSIYLIIKLCADAYFIDFSKSKEPIFKDLKQMAALDLYRCTFFAGLATLYWTASNISRFERKAIDAEIKQLKATNDNLALEANLARSKNALLRQQINPHLLFNSLSFIHSTVYRVSEEAAENVLLLGDLMRFGLEDPEPDGKIAVDKEIEQLYNLIRINQARFGRITAVNFHVIGDIAGYRIIPLVLMTLAENVFKHGDLTTYPAIITLQVDATGRLRFHTRNRVKPEIPFPRLKSTGLENIRIRLDFAYGDTYQLNLTENDHFYEAELLI